MKITNQCVGRSIRNKKDYSVVIFADKRYKISDPKIKNNFPEWIRNNIELKFTDVSADQSIDIVRDYLLQMSYNSTKDYLNEEMSGKEILNHDQTLQYLKLKNSN